MHAASVTIGMAPKNKKSQTADKGLRSDNEKNARETATLKTRPPC